MLYVLLFDLLSSLTILLLGEANRDAAMFDPDFFQKLGDEGTCS